MRISKEKISFLASMLIFTLLFFQGFALNLYVNSTTTINESDILHFRVYVDIKEGENAPIQMLAINITGTDNYSRFCTFSIDGTNDCDKFTITPNRFPAFDYSSDRFAYGNGISANGTIGYFNESFGSGFGYGAGYNITTGELDYNISWQTPGVFKDTNYSIQFYAYALNTTFITDNITQITVLEVPKTLNKSIIIDKEKTDIIIDAYSNITANITITQNATYTTLNLSSNMTNNSITVLPRINIYTDIGQNRLSVSIPKNTTITSNDTWNGKIILPTITNATISLSGYTTTTYLAFILGDYTHKISFDKAIRINISNSKGKLTGYFSEGNFTAITQTCNDSQNWTNANVTDACSIDIGNDTIIWTKHMTTFVTYSATQNPQPSSSSSDSSSSSSSNKASSLSALLDTSYSKSWNDVLSGYELIMDINHYSMPIRNIMIKTNKDIASLSLTVVMLDNKPEIVDDINATKYFRIYVNGIKNSEIKQIRIIFRELNNAQNNTQDKLQDRLQDKVLYRWDHGWKILSTKKITSTDSYNYFEANSDGLGYFAIADDKKNILNVSFDTKDNISTHLTGKNKSTNNMINKTIHDRSEKSQASPNDNNLNAYQNNNLITKKPFEEYIKIFIVLAFIGIFALSVIFLIFIQIQKIHKKNLYSRIYETYKYDNNGHPDLKRWVIYAKNQGLSKKDIKKALLSKGWENKYIEEALKDI